MCPNQHGGSRYSHTKPHFLFLGPQSSLFTQSTHAYSCSQRPTFDTEVTLSKGFPGGSGVKNPPASVGDAGLIPGLDRSLGEGNGYPLQYSCRGIPWTEEPGGLQSMVSQRVGHDLAALSEPHKSTDNFSTGHQCHFRIGPLLCDTYRMNHSAQENGF